MGFKSIIKKLKYKLTKVRERKYKLALMEKNLRNMRYLAVEIKENGEYFTPCEREEIEVEFKRLKEEVNRFRFELEDDQS